MKTIDLDQWKVLIIAADEALALNEKRLNELDSMIGDGDHGSSIKRGFDAARDSILDTPISSVGALFSRVGSALLQEIGGAIGPLIGSFFTAAAKQVLDRHEVDIHAWALMFSGGVERVRSLGKAHIGEKTMLDALQPALEALQESASLELPIGFAFRRAADAARGGADQTASMVAKFGRAKFVGERSLGHQDPGANSIAVILDAMAGALADLDRNGGIEVQDDDAALIIMAGNDRVKVHKEGVLFEFSSPVSDYVLRQSVPLSFYKMDGKTVNLERITHWSLESEQLILLCETQQARCQVVILLDFPSPQSCRISTYCKEGDFNQTSLAFSSTVDENFFGGGERFSTVNQRGKRLECWADDRGPQQQPDHPWTYWPVPFFISTYGYSLFINNPDKSLFDLCATCQDVIEVTVGTTNIKYEIFWAEQPVDHILRQFERSGYPPLPPSWNNGVWVTCLGGQEAVLEKAQFLRREHIPSSALWVYDANDPKGNIGWPICPMHHSGVYPDLPGLVKTLHEMGFKVQTYLFPYFYVGTLPYDEAFEKGYFLKNPDGSTYQFPFWKAVGRDMVQVPASILDFTNPQAKVWWQGLIRYILVDLGFDGWMHDFAENVPDSVVAFNGLSGAALHNLYPLLYQQAAREVCLQEKPDASFYARSGTSGSQAWLTAAWPGDQVCTWGKNEGLSSAVTACLSLSLSGMFFIGPDIGGYFSRGLPQEKDSFSKELWIRWTQFGALSSIMRDHLTDKPDGAVELWTDEETRGIFKQYAWLHMSLSPYIQGCAAQAVKTGRPIMQHMFLVEPDNATFWDCDDQYLFGDALLVAPILEEGQRIRPIHLPQGTWIGYWDGHRYEGGRQVSMHAPLDKIPILVREGTVLPTLLDPADTVVESSIDSINTATDALLLHVFLSADEKPTSMIPSSSQRVLADGTTITCEWSTSNVHIRVGSIKSRRFMVVIPMPERPAACSVNGRQFAFVNGPSKQDNSYWYDDQIKALSMNYEGGEVDLEIRY